MKPAPLEVEKKNIGFFFQQLTTKTALETLERPNEVFDEGVKEVTEYPKIEQQLFVSETIKKAEMKPTPLDVEKKNIGYYEKLKIKEDMKNEEMKLESLVNTTNILPETTKEPIQQFVSIYSSGRSDEYKTAEYPEIEEAFLVSYETCKQPEMKPIALEIERKNVGYYENLPLPSITQEKKPEESSFETCKATELDKSQIDQFVNIYSSGRSDEISTSTKTEEQIIEIPSIGQVSETKRQLDIDSVPMEVEKKSILGYEHLTIKKDEEEEEKSLEHPGLCLGDFIGGKKEMRKKKKVKKGRGRREEENEEEKGLEKLHQKKLEEEIEQQPVFESEGRKETGKVGEGEEGSLLTEGRVLEEEKRGGEEEEQNKVIEVSERLPSFVEPLKEMIEYLNIEQASHKTVKQTEMKPIPLNVEKKNIKLKGKRNLKKHLKNFQVKCFLKHKRNQPLISTLLNLSMKKKNCLCNQLKMRKIGEEEEEKEAKPLGEASEAIEELSSEKEPIHAQKEVIHSSGNIHSSQPSDKIPTTKMTEYPKEPFIYNTNKLNKKVFEEVPLKVENKHIGFYNKLPSIKATEEEEEQTKFRTEQEEELFKGDETYEEFTLNYEPSIQITSIVVPEITKEPIHEVANVYSSGRSDEISTTTTITTEHPKIIESSPVTKIQTELEGVLFGVEKKNIEEEAIEEDKKDLKPKIKEEEEEEEKSFEHSGFCLGDFIGGKKEMRKKKKVKEGKGEKEQELEELQKRRLEKEIEQQPVLEIEEMRKTGMFGESSKNFMEHEGGTLLTVRREDEERKEQKKEVEMSGRLPSFIEPSKEDKRAKITEYPKIEEAVSYETTKKHPEMKPRPLEVEKKNIGYYKDLPPPSIVQETNPEEPLFETCKSTELDKSKIDQFVNIYSSGRSDEVSRTTTTEMIEQSEIKEPSPIETKMQTELESVPFGVEKKNIEEETVKEAEEDLKPKLKEGEEEKEEKSWEHSGLCLGDFIEGKKEMRKKKKVKKGKGRGGDENEEVKEVDELQQKKLEKENVAELRPEPLEIENKHVGYYEQLPSLSFVQEMTSEKLLFETYKSTELDKFQIDQFVNIYSSGRSDEIITSTKKIEVASISKVLETKRQLNIDSVPMEVEKKNIGFYENLPSTFYQEKKPKTVESLQFIEPSSGRSDKPQPISKTQQEEIESGIKLNEIMKPKIKEGEEKSFEHPSLCLGDFIEEGKKKEKRKKKKVKKGKGRREEEEEKEVEELQQKGSAEKEIEQQIVLESEEMKEPGRVGEEGGSLLKGGSLLTKGRVLEEEKKEKEEEEEQNKEIEMSGRLPSFIEPSKEMTEYPKIEEASLISHKTNKQEEMKPIPLEVEKKHVGYYEKLKPSIIEDKTKTEKEEILKEALLIDNLPETLKQIEMDLIPLEVEKKNVGYYENLPSPSIVQEKKPEDLFEACKSTELDKSQIDQFVNVYSSGRSDEISTSTKMEEHKIEESFPIQETKIQTELEGVSFSVEKKNIEEEAIKEDEKDLKPKLKEGEEEEEKSFEHPSLCLGDFIEEGKKKEMRKKKK
uniref:Uncharacterized protein n=1 Tax=Meloidogyne enterolobii TaxID=390850 RepID=A0A6V7VFB0_MELEN|nr:unnamed protein product [Meloidogyne enterolobii]